MRPRGDAFLQFYNAFFLLVYLRRQRPKLLLPAASFDLTDSVCLGGKDPLGFKASWYDFAPRLGVT
jgi:hypothetical protein